MSMVELPVKIILDTSIYIPFINEGITFPKFNLQFARAVTYMSAVVIEESNQISIDSKIPSCYFNLRKENS